ncbi:hypothetical protein ACLB2K_010404 [Fragaria x ananassa]
MAIRYLKWRKTSASQVENKLDISIQFLTLFLRLMPRSSRPMDISKITEENISNMIMVKLNRSNYTLWRLRFLRVLKKYKVYGLVEGSDSCLPAFVINSRGYITDVINPAYDIWMERDRIVKLWLTSTITEDLLHNMAGKTSAMDLWLTLEKRSLGAARSHTHDQLRSQLETISKGNMSMNEYLQQIKQLGDGLAAVGAPIYGVELIQYVLNGLPEEYEPFVIDTVLRVHRTSIDELSNLLLNKEGYMVQNRMSPTSPEPLHGQANVLEICPVGTRAEIKLAAMNFSPNSWRRGQLLGRGTFGSVYQGFSENGLRFAVKEVSLLDQGSQGRKCLHQLQQEISLLSRLQHENIIQYYGSYEHESNLYMCMELAPHGSLRKYYQTCHLSGPRVSVYTKKILLGLKYLHDQNVVHRDIKCSNILVDANRSVKLADFGLAKITKMNDIQSLQGSVFWMAPEVVNANMINQGYGLPADIWSLGCTVLETFTGRVPYHNLEWCQALFKIGKGEPPKVPDSLPKDAQDFIHKCLQVNPNDRLTAAQLLDHPFVNMPLINPTSPRLPTIFDDVQHYKGIYRCAFNPESCTKLK